MVDALLDIGSGLADAADRYIDQARMAPAQFIGPEAEPLHGAGTKILHQYVGLGHELGQNFAANFALDVDRQRALAPVRGDEQRREFAGLVDGGAAAAGGITAPPLQPWPSGGPLRGGQRRGRARTPPRANPHPRAV